MSTRDIDHQDMRAEAVIARAITRRGAIFDEFWLLAQVSPHRSRRLHTAWRYRLSTLQGLQGIACALPMTGTLTAQIGARAMQMAESAAA